MKIEYKKEFLDFVGATSSLNKKVFIKIDGEQVIIGQKDEEQSGQYLISAPKSYFDFGKPEMALVNFPEFKKVVSSFKEPVLEYVDNKIEISSGKEKFVYLVSDPEIIDDKNKFKGFKKDAKIEIKASLNLVKDDFNKILNYVSLTKADYIRFKVDGSKVVIGIENKSFSNSAEITIDVDNSVQEDFEFCFDAGTFSKLPVADYTINLLAAKWFECVVTLGEITFKYYIPNKSINNG